MKRELYAVKKGRIPGIYMTWDECEAQVNKFSGAEYKKFTNRMEANIYLGIKTDEITTTPNTLIAYIGGFRNEDTVGFVIIYEEPDLNIINKVGASFSCKPVEKVAKFAPYFVGCFYAIEEAIINHYQQIVICSYESDLEKWTHEKYGGFTYIAKQFKKYIEISRKKINIIFSSGSGYKVNLINEAYETAKNVADSKYNFLFKIPLL